MKRLIEVAFPIREVGEQAMREKNIRHGHISTLHIWWARRPLAAMRAAIFAALVDDPDDEEERKQWLDFIARLSQWENSLSPKTINKARRQILQDNGNEPPKVLDCFAGGGSIPLEALRLGCEAYALEYNPVATLILKATVEYPQKFGKSLIDAVKKWGSWVLDEARKELEQFYPVRNSRLQVASTPAKAGYYEQEEIPVGYIWARTIPCQNPTCGAEIPLMRQFWLAKKKNRQIALKPIVDKKRKQVDFVIVEGKDIDFDPSQGTVRRARATCLVCGGVVPDKRVRELFREGKAGQRMVAVVVRSSPLQGASMPKRQRPLKRATTNQGKRYRLPTEQDLQAFRNAEEALARKVEALREKWGMEPVPDEPTPVGGGPGAERAFSVHKYGMTRWGDLFNARQKLALLTFAERVREAYGRMANGERGMANGEEFAKAVVTYLVLGIGKVADYCSVLCQWRNNLETVGHTFARQALPMLWDYVEGNLVTGASGTWKGAVEQILKTLSHCAQAPPTAINSSSLATRHSPLTVVQQGTATKLPYPDHHFDAVITDPPYYDNVPYSDLSDFFYVWLKRTVGDLYPELFLTPLTPKSEELVADTVRRGGSMEAAWRWFEEGLTQAFREIARVLKDDGIAVIIFAHKSVEAWDAIINALLNAGLTMTASWPVRMEMESRLRMQSSAALLSSVLMVCRKRQVGAVGDYPKVLQEMRQRIAERLSDFWQEGLRGADYFMSAIGPAVEVFGRYERVEKPTGEPATVAELLHEVRSIVAEDALQRILLKPAEAGYHELSGIDPASRFYLLWRWTFNGMQARKTSQGPFETAEGEGGKAQTRTPRVPYDDARLIAQAVIGAEVVQQGDWEHWGFVRIQRASGGAEVQVLPADERSDEEFRRERFETMIDALHYALRLWEKRQYRALQEHLTKTYGGNDTFWRYAQALSEVLPDGDKERRLLHGLLAWHRTKPSDKEIQPTLFEASE